MRKLKIAGIAVAVLAVALYASFQIFFRTAVPSYEGTVTIELADHDLTKIVGVVDRTSDKVIVAVVVGAIIVGSSLILRIADLPVPGYISILATLGYVVAVIVGFYAVYSALRQGR